ncbi:Suppressor of RPS4-RLD 1 [Glycine soja]
MAPATSQRAELARVFDSFVSQSGAIKDICNRAFCYSQLELHKHVIKDCDKALQLDPSRLQAYILKATVCRFEAVARARRAFDNNKTTPNNAFYETNGSPVPQSESDSMSNGNLTEICKNQDSLSPQDELCDNTSDKSLILLKSADNFDLRNELNSEDRESNKSDGQVNGSTDVIDKLSYNSESCNNLSDTSESRDKDKVVASLVVTHLMLMKGNMLTPYPFLISCNGLLPSDIWGVSFYLLILKEDPAYPEALIGRGTAYAFKRELDAAMADFSKAIEFNPSAGEAWKRRGQARAALGGVCGGMAIEDLTKALEFESNSADILHERGIANFKFKEFDAAVEDLSACVQLGRDNESAYTCLLCLKLLFNIILVVSFMNMRVLAVLSRFIKANKAQECLNQMLQIDGSSSGMLILFKHHRTLDIAKTVIKEKSYVYSKTDQIICLFKDGKLEEVVIHANSVSDLYNVVGEDFWSSTWCNSTAFEGKQLEGTRITLVKMGSLVLTLQLEHLVHLLDGRIMMQKCQWHGKLSAMLTVVKIMGLLILTCLKMYNFMLLSRGSAVVGFVVMLGLLLAANMEFTGSIPQGFQVSVCSPNNYIAAGLS